LKRLISFLILLLILLAPSNLCAANFYAYGSHFIPREKITRIEGQIVSVIGEGQGQAGIEQDAIFETNQGKLTIEIVNWYRGYKYTRDCNENGCSEYSYQKCFEVGIVIYLNNQSKGTYYWKAEPRELFYYLIEVRKEGIYAEIKNEKGIVVLSKLIDYFPCKVISQPSCYLEYWKDKKPFLYYGFVTVKDANKFDLSYFAEGCYAKREDGFWAVIWSHNWDNEIYFKGEIDNR